MDNMTALVSAFARAYHYKNNDDHVFADSLAEKMLMEEEYTGISQYMVQGISFFAPGFKGTQEEALRYIVDKQLAPSVLARSAFCERAIDNAVRMGCRQAVIFACGYDTFSLRKGSDELKIFELDRPEMIEDRKHRINRMNVKPASRAESIGCDLSQPSWKEGLIQAGFNPKERTFGSCLGISYYLYEEEFRGFLETISSIWSDGSSICFDYPMMEDGTVSNKNRELAAAAGEEMKARYTYEMLETLLLNTRFRIYEHLDAAEATEAFFCGHNDKNVNHIMTAPEGVGYCLAVKKNNLVT